MQALVSRDAAPKVLYRALNSAVRCYKTKSLPPILGLDLPDIWTPPPSSLPRSSQLIPPNNGNNRHLSLKKKRRMLIQNLYMFFLLSLRNKYKRVVMKLKLHLNSLSNKHKYVVVLLLFPWEF